MINDDNQDVDFENNEEEVVEVEEEETTEDETDWKAEALKYKAILDRNKTKKADEKPASKSKSDDFGYDVKAYLKASGIQAGEFDFVRTELKQSGIKDVDSLLENSYFKDRLEKHREIQKATDATPTGKRSGTAPTDTVEYWLGKPIEEVPANMRIKVVNAKLDRDKNKGQFYNS